MVHALKEAWRVLDHPGILIDLRPYGLRAPLEVIQGEHHHWGGYVDVSLGKSHDYAADRAVKRVVNEGLFERIKSDYFNRAYYWASIGDLQADLEDDWKEDMIIPLDVKKKVANILRKSEGAQVRIKLHTKLVVYKKKNPR